MLKLALCSSTIVLALILSATPAGAHLAEPSGKLYPLDSSGYKRHHLDLFVGKSKEGVLVLETFNLTDKNSRRQLDRTLSRLIALKKEDMGKDETAFVITKGMRKGLEEAQRLLQEGHGQDNEATYAVMEILYSFNTNFMKPVPLDEDILAVFPRLDNVVGVGKKPATNIEGSSRDLSLHHPRPSSFWTPPQDIERQDLYFGYKRKSLPVYEDLICTYKEPKAGYGTRAGFEIECPGDLELKLKWGNETHSEPFVTRIFNALGFNTMQVDYFREMKVTYSRDILKEFNSRKALETEITFLHLLPIKNLVIGGEYKNPFDVIHGARLKSGKVISTADLRAQLLKTQEVGSERNDSAYNERFERKIDYLIFKPGNVETKEENYFTVGAWGWQDLGYYNDDEILPYSSLGHRDRRELRAAGLLAAWLSSYDVRWDNNRLRLIEREDGSLQLRHYISDLGAGLGRAANFLSTSLAQVNDFSWTFTQGEFCDNGNDRNTNARCMAHGFTINRFQTIDRNETFKRMTRDDARWMARWISQLRVEQIRDALIAAGFSAAEVELYQEKLVHRRYQMLRDLSLFAEANSQRPGDRKITKTYPKSNVTMRLTNGIRVDVSTKGCQLERGRLVCGKK